MKLDSLDLKILDAMQKDATLSTVDIAARVGLSQSPCWSPRARSTTTTRFVQKKLAQIPGIRSIDSRIVLEETKNTTELPLVVGASSEA
jgi:DNA-binding Lrp family transcriptional regulator